MMNAPPIPPPLDSDSCYRAMLARDARFDGVFFVGVTTTGVYCRPVCPARTPGASRCRFFRVAAEAEREGFRACLRCRPELAPGASPTDAVPQLAAQAVRHIQAGYLNDASVEDLAATLGVSARHLRRACQAAFGVTPVELAQTQRLALAKRLLHDTGLPLTDVAFAAGFASLRRFNAVFRDRFGRPPSALRRAGATPADGADGLSLRLDYRPPLDWSTLLAFIRQRAIPGVERVDEDTYRRTVALGDTRGWLSVAPDPSGRPALLARASVSLAPRLMTIVARLRALFDLDADPRAIADHLGADPRFREVLASVPGVRLPGAFDGFETTVRAVLGQQVSVAAATTLAGRLVARFGAVAEGAPEGLTRYFPGPEVLAEAGPDAVAALGLPKSRARTLVAVAASVASGELGLTPGTSAPDALDCLERVPGVGPWTREVLALRVLHWPDAFPAGDLGVQRALSVSGARAAERLAEPWRPWRGYATMLLWQSHAHAGGA